MPEEKFESFDMGRFDEKKIFLPMRPEHNEHDCVWLTVGIGGDDQVERQFKLKYPGCRMFGVEASPDQYAGFGNLGQVIPHAVGVEQGSFMLIVRENGKYHGEYHEKNITVLPFYQLLDFYVGQRLVHYMTIDIEGFEYSILDEILPGKKLALQGITFCQIDAELHNVKLNNYDSIADFVRQFLTPDSPYLPIYYSLFLKKHHKLTFINTKHHECQKMFDMTEYLKKPSYGEESTSEDGFSSSQVIVQAFRECTKKAFQNSISAAVYFENFDDCVHLLPFLKFDYFRTAYFDEDKIFLPMKPEYDQSNCTWLTVGIGGDDRAEREFKLKYPGCKMFGIEGSPDQYAGFRQFAKVIPYAVGIEAGTLSLKVRESTRYVDKKVEVLPFLHLLDTYVGQRFFHYMTIDIEGVEYSILKELLPGGKLDKEGVVFCQIDAELHRFPPESEDHVKDFLQQFNAPDSHYLPVYRALFLSKHHKVTFVNIHEKECQEAFDLTSYMK